MFTTTTTEGSEISKPCGGSFRNSIAIAESHNVSQVATHVRCVLLFLSFVSPASLVPVTPCSLFLLSPAAPAIVFDPPFAPFSFDWQEQKSQEDMAFPLLMRMKRERERKSRSNNLIYQMKHEVEYDVTQKGSAQSVRRAGGITANEKEEAAARGERDWQVTHTHTHVPLSAIAVLIPDHR